MKLKKLLVLLMLAVFAVVLSACGAQGLAGAQGPQGEKGDTGATGAKGATGDQGITGEEGDAGTDGIGIEFSFTSDGIAWRYVGEKTWNLGVAYADIFAQINQAGVGKIIQGIGFDYVVDGSLSANDGAEVNVYGIKKVMGQTAFATIEDAFDAINNDTTEGQVKLFINAGQYSVEEGREATLTRSNVKVYGPNVNSDPNNETRVSAAVVNSKLTVAGNDVEINGLDFSTSGRIWGANTGIENLTVQYVVFDSSIDLTGANDANEGCITLRIDPTLENANTYWYKNITLAYSKFEANGKRAEKLVANQVDGFLAYGNSFYGNKNALYDDCFKFYLWSDEVTAKFYSVTGSVKVYGNYFENISQYSIWLNKYGPVTVDVQGNTFTGCGMADSKDTQVTNGYIRGCLTCLVSANYDYTQKSSFNFAYNYCTECSSGVRIQNDGFTADNFEANVNYNVFDEICVGAEIVTNRGKNTLNLINADYNCFTAVGGVTLEANFKGVASIDHQYTTPGDVPTKTLADLLA